MSYPEGLEDGIVLCLQKLNKSKSITDAKKDIDIILNQVQEKKCRKLEALLSLE